MKTTRLGAISVGGLLLLTIGSVAPEVAGQARVKLRSTDQDASRLGVELPQDRVLSRGIRKAHESLAKGQFTQTVRFLDQVLANDNDYFYEASGHAEIVGMKEIARRLLRNLPAEGREVYQNAFGPVAKRELEKAIASGKRKDLAEVVQRYFYTPAGYEAAWLLAQLDADAGRHLLAGLNYQQLLATPDAVTRLNPGLALRAAACFAAGGDRQLAEATLQELAKSGEQRIELAGEPHKFNVHRATPQWISATLGPSLNSSGPSLTDWRTYRGDPARNAKVDGGLPHMRTKWEARLLDNPQLVQALNHYSGALLKESKLAPSANAPLAVGNQILVRTVHGLMAVDFATGKRIWQAEPQRGEELEEMARNASGSGERQVQPKPAPLFTERIWEDYLYNTLSSDGERVFAIRDLSEPQYKEDDLFVGFRGGHEIKPVKNRLCAYDLATQGKLVWEIDGANSKGPLPGAFFLGAPLPLGDMLFSLVEVKNSVRLVAIHADTGEVQWRQQLVNLDKGVASERSRRMQSASPSFETGMLVCPLGAGMVVGVDLGKRSLAWAYRYDRKQNLRFGHHEIEEQLDYTDRWTDPGLVISEGKVLMTPPESASLHCLELHTGKLLWKKRRAKFNRLAGVDQGRVLLVGTRRLEAVLLADGKRAWKKQLTLPVGILPTGTGFFSSGEYFLPLSSGQVVAIDILSGEITRRAISPHGHTLGNLICHRGSVLSQNGQFLQRFDQVELLKKQAEQILADSPNDAEALRILGEVAYNEGRLSEAITLLDHSYQSDTSAFATREVLAQCLVSALDRDFAAFKRRLPLLEEIQGESLQQRLNVLRIKSSGLLADGDLLGAAQACLDIYQLAPAVDEKFELADERLVTVTRWVCAQVRAIGLAANPEQRDKILSAISHQASPQKLTDIEGIQAFVEYFGSLREYEPLRLELALRWQDQGHRLLAQQLFVDLTESDNSEIRGTAVAGIAVGLHEAGQHFLAVGYDNLLASTYADQVCYQGKTGQQLLEQWPREIVPSVDWPTGRVTTAVKKPVASRVTPQVGIRIERTDRLLGACHGKLSTRMRSGVITLQDSLGREFFRQSVSGKDDSQNQFQQPNFVYAVSHGSLFVTSLGRQIIAYNTLPNDDSSIEGGAGLLWQSLLTNNEAISSFRNTRRSNTSKRPGSYRPQRTSWEGNWMGVIGPVNSRGCVFQSERRLMCVDPVSGSVLWSRKDVPSGCDLFGSAEYVFVTPSGSRTASVYSMIDGRFLKKRQVPRWNDQLATRGTRVVSWSSDRSSEAAQRMKLQQHNALTGETDWTHSFPNNSCVDVVDNRYVLVVTPAGRCVVLDLEHDASKASSFLVDATLPRTLSLSSVYLMVSVDSLVVLTNGKKTSKAKTISRPDYALVSGQVMAFDRITGEPLWQRTAEVEQTGWMLNQAEDLPMLVFAANRSRSGASGTGINTSVLVIDKRTGRTLFRKDDFPSTNSGYCIAKATDLEQRTTVVAMAKDAVELTFTDLPRPPQPPAMAEVETHSVKPEGGLSRLLLGR